MTVLRCDNLEFPPIHNSKGRWLLKVVVKVIIGAILIYAIMAIYKGITKNSTAAAKTASDEDLDRLVEQCRNLQKNSAKKLREIAKLLREEQQKLNKHKIAIDSVGLVSGSLSLAGAFLAPFSGGFSLALIVAGSGMGIALGAGDIVNTKREIAMIGQKVKVVETVLDDLNKKTEELLEKLKPKIAMLGYSWNEIMLPLKKGKVAYDVYALAGNIRKAIQVAKTTSHAERIAIFLGGGEIVAAAVAGAGGAKILKVGGPVLNVAGIGFSMYSIIDNSIKVNGNVSEAADAINKIAESLEKTD